MNLEITNPPSEDKKFTIFDETLEDIDVTKITNLIDKISKNLPLEGLQEEEEINYEKGIESTTIEETRTEESYPLFVDGSFKLSIRTFLNNPKNKPIKDLFDRIKNEIQKIYRGYIRLENKLYEKINYMMKFADSENNKPLEIISKLKEIYEILLETKRFILHYYHRNLSCLQKLFIIIDDKLSNMFNVKSISLYYILKIFDLPNNELSYMLMFKIIDEESCILKNLTNRLIDQINGNNSVSVRSSKIDSPNTQCLITEDSVAEDAINNLAEDYKEKIINVLIYIDSYEIFRAKYPNKFLYTRGNYILDSNKYLNDAKEEDEDNNNNDDSLPINSLMDEEVIIKKFIKKEIIEKFLENYKNKLRKSYKRNEKLILIHSIQFYLVAVLMLFGYRNFKSGLLEFALFNLGKIISKIIFNKLLMKQGKMKITLIFSNLLLIISLFLPLINNITEKSEENNEINSTILISRLLAGFSYAKNIESRFLLNYVPKLIMYKTIKKYFFLRYLSLFIGFCLNSSLYFCLKKLDDILAGTSENNYDKINQIEIIYATLSTIILFFNIILFKEPRYEDLQKSSSEKISENPTAKDNKEETKTIFSYGKAKFISFGEKKKAQLLEETLKINSDNRNYEGTNQIFNTLSNLMLDEYKNSKSLTNKVTLGFNLLLLFTTIINIIIFYFQPIINENNIKGNKGKNEEIQICFIFGIPFFIGYIVSLFEIKNCCNISKNISKLKMVVLIFFIIEICLSTLFFFLEKLVRSGIKHFDIILNAYQSLLLLFNILIETLSIKVMVKLIPIEKKHCSMNIDNFFDIFESIIRFLTLVGLFLINDYNFLKDKNYYRLLILSCYLICVIVFINQILQKKQNALTKVMNKITFET